MANYSKEAERQNKALKDLMSGERTSNLSYDYDWKTNLYKK